MSYHAATLTKRMTDYFPIELATSIVLVVLTLVMVELIRRQLKSYNDIARADFTFRLYDIYEDLAQIREKVSHNQPLTEPEKKKLGNFFEHLGFMVNRKYLKLKDVNDLAGFAVLRCWDAVEDQRDQPKAWEFFQLLRDQIDDKRKEKEKSKPSCQIKRDA